ncbi:IS110 family transposase [Pseudofrankia sp. BMG5.37]|uniref:IS110 family transposase n=1 Tax=Pseudofrankia sp. BMG5.37 TaxID=3050035 RepID=UPI0008DAF3AD|nr:IS110 family transposase [Pseudofrankia sp. BMG5.37]MDT3445605.1 IS110 family transposase [Pseudofrankia sp. BMG5.37]OHV52119.1 hypothetical protein BCD48_45020 [Pseudofrankia sp. BMG5.36]
MLEAAGLRCWLVNARQVKHLPGRPKTDKIDSVWLCKVAERGMCSPSFVPARPQRQLRLFTRYRIAAVRERTREMQRAEKLLEDAQLKVSVVASDLFGVSGRAMLTALVAGERDPEVLADLARGRLRRKRTELVRAFRGSFEDAHALVLAMILDRIERLDSDIARLDASIAEAVAAMTDHAPAQDRSGPGCGAPSPDTAAGGPTPESPPPAGGGARLGPAERLAEIPGISLATAHTILAEVGTDVAAFPTAAHLVSWAGLAPKANQSAGRSSPARTTKGNRYLAGALGQVVFSLARTQTFFGDRYRRIRASRGPQKAVVAVSRSVLTTIWHLLDDPDTRYRELGADYHRNRQDTHKQAAAAVRRLERLGFEVTLAQPAAAI